MTKRKEKSPWEVYFKMMRWNSEMLANYLRRKGISVEVAVKAITDLYAWERKAIIRGATIASLAKRYQALKAKAEEERKYIEGWKKAVIEKNQILIEKNKALVEKNEKLIEKTNEIIDLRDLVEALEGQIESWKKASQSYAATAREKTDEALRALEHEGKVVAEKEQWKRKFERKCEEVARLNAEMEKIYARGLWDRIWNNIPD